MSCASLVSRSRLALVLVVMGLALSSAFAQAPKAAPATPASEPSTHVLTPSGTHVFIEPNGLVVLIRENHQAPVVSVRIVVRTGSMYEGKYLGCGISHLTEHLVHSAATAKRTEEQGRKLLDELGGDTNAGTTDAWTDYYIDTASSRVADAVDLLSDWVINAIIPRKEFVREHDVVTRELERSRDSVDHELGRLALENAYRVHPVRVPTIGYLPQLKALTRQDVLDYYHSRYIPNNMIIGIVGDVDYAKAHALVARAFAAAKRKPLPPVFLPDEPKPVDFRPLVEQRPGLNVTRMVMGFPTVKLDNDDMYPLDLLSFVLSEGQSSRLVRELRDKQKLVSHIDTSSYTPSFVDGEFTIDAVIMRSATHDKVHAAVWEQLNSIMNTPVTDDELRQAKTQKTAEHVFAMQTVGSQCSDMLFSFLDTNDPDYSRLYVDRIQRVTADDIMRVAKKYFIRERESFTVLEPLLLPMEESRSAKEPAALPAAPQTKAVLFKLDNGMRLLVKRNPAVPVVSIQAYLMGGLRAESLETIGLARLTSEMIVRGSQTKSADDIARAFESMGGEIGASSANSTCFVTAAVLAQSADPALSVFADVLRNPSFPQTELDGLRNRTLMALAAQKDRLPVVASRAFRKAMFPATVFGLDPLGSPESLPRITRDDLLAFYRAHVRPSALVLAVYGDVDPELTLKEVKAGFGDWTDSPVSGYVAVPDKPVPAPLLVVNPVSKHETAIVYVGYRGMPVTDTADVDPMTVLQEVMGGYPGGWLHTELRGDQKGLVYEASSYNASNFDVGTIVAYAQCQPPKVKEVTRIILDEFDRARKGKVTLQELSLAKAHITTTRPLALQTNASQAGEAVVEELYGLGFRFGDTLTTRINAVTLDDMTRVANKYFKNPVVVVTTPDPDAAKEIKGLLPAKAEK